MAQDASRKGKILRKLEEETERYLLTAAFLAAFFVAFTAYRRLVLAEYHLGSFAFGFAIVKALILAKVVLIGQALHVGDRLQGRPLVLKVLWKTFTFSLLVAAFTVLEHVVGALLHHRPVAEEFRLTIGQRDELLARVILETVAFAPLFAFQELGRYLGEEKLMRLFFRGTGKPPPGDAGRE